MATFPPPPTFAEMVLEDPEAKKTRLNPVWQKWFYDVAQVFGSAGVGGGTGLAIQHNSLGSIQGGSTTERYHLTQAQNVTVTRASATLADATSITPNATTTSVASQVNTQAVGTLTVNAPTGTPDAGQRLILRLTCSNVQTYSWNGVYTGSTDLTLPTTSSGSGLTDYLGFVYNSTTSKWNFMAFARGY